RSTYSERRTSAWRSVPRERRSARSASWHSAGWKRSWRRRCTSSSSCRCGTAGWRTPSAIATGAWISRVEARRAQSRLRQAREGGPVLIEWRDEAFVLAARPHGEAAAVVQLLTRHHGRHAGLVPGGQGQRLSPVVQPGNAVVAKWRARLPEQLGTFALALVHGNAGRVLQVPARLEALASAAAVPEAILPEREAQPGTYEAFAALLAALPEAAWAEAYVQWELLMLAAVG